MATFELPFPDRIDRSSGPSKEGFDTNEIKYSGKVRQITFSGASQEASRMEEYQITWKQIQYSSPEEVAAGAVNELETLFTFYQQAYLEKVRWKPFEVADTRIWEIIPNSLKRKNAAGGVFDVTIKLKLLYKE